MIRAIELARESAQEGEIPVGAVIVKNNEIIGEGRNMREAKKSALSHAETEAIFAANKTLCDWRLDGCEMYVTLEPCAMCAGAIINSRLSTLIFGAYDLERGCIDSAYNLCSGTLGTPPEIYGGIMEDECREILRNFFEKIRNK
ncbi:MAG: nucleoside deaminase [Clostridia bacterium]|nr:nucleoside deaminase [Clostridia bacterium]